MHRSMKYHPRREKVNFAFFLSCSRFFRVFTFSVFLCFSFLFYAKKDMLRATVAPNDRFFLSKLEFGSSPTDDAFG